MNASSFRVKLVSLFVLAFLCLNVGGAVCLAYCQTAIKLAAEHCPLQKAGSDCHRNQGLVSNTDDPAASASEARCCSLAIGIIAAPVEKKQIAAEIAAVAERPVVHSFSLPLAHVSEAPALNNFVPPKLDSRGLRLRNCVFRI